MLFHGQPVKVDHNRCDVITSLSSGYETGCSILHSVKLGEKMVKHSVEQLPLRLRLSVHISKSLGTYCATTSDCVTASDSQWIRAAF